MRFGRAQLTRVWIARRSERRCVERLTRVIRMSKGCAKDECGWTRYFVVALCGICRPRRRRGDLLVAEVPHRGLGPSSITCATPGAEALRWEEAGLYPELARDEFSVHASEEHSGTYHQYDAADYQRGIVPVGMKRAERDQ
jgi:hypothetical protein